jgi:hypothetical protein
MKLYIAGPMRGQPLMNFPRFNVTAMKFRKKGHIVFNPAEADVNADGFNPETDKPLELAHYMVRDLPEVCQADAVVVLPDWQHSQGACMEVMTAIALGKTILDDNGSILNRRLIVAQLIDFLGRC